MWPLAEMSIQPVARTMKKERIDLGGQQAVCQAKVMKK